MEALVLERHQGLRIREIDIPSREAVRASGFAPAMPPASVKAQIVLG